MWFRKCLAIKGEGMNIYFTSSFVCFNPPPFIDCLQYTQHSVRCLRLTKPWELCLGTSQSDRTQKRKEVSDGHKS